MNRRLIGVLTFALLVATATSSLVYRLVVAHVQAPAARPAMQSNRLVVAAHDLQVGALIADGDLEEINWPGPIPEQTLKTRQELVGRGVIANIFKNEPISVNRLAARGAGAGLASTIPIGKRAVALRVNEVVGLAGFVLPGMRVDVLIAGSAPGLQAQTVRCKTILQNIEVLSAGQKIEKSLDGKPETAEVVNLLVTPEQAEILNLASSETKVQLVLRNPLDNHEEVTHGTSLAVLFGGKDGVPAMPVQMARVLAPRAVAAPLPTVEVYNGVKRSDQTVTPAGEIRQ
jgi:pilus assembly protein CpaB